MTILNKDLWNYIYSFDAFYSQMRHMYKVHYSSLVPSPSFLHNNEYYKVEINNFISSLPYWNVQCVFRNIPDYTRFLEQSKRDEPFKHSKQKVIKLCEYYNNGYKECHQYISSITCYIMPVFIFDLCSMHPLLKKRLKG